MLTKTYEETKKLLDNFAPIDIKSNISDLDFYSSSNIENNLYDKKRKATFHLDDFSARQFLRKMNPKSNLDFLNDLSPSAKENVVNDIITSYRKDNYSDSFLIRNTNDVSFPNYNSIAFLSSSYKPLNHNRMIDGIKQYSDLPIKSEVNWSYAVVRIPTVQISTHGKGVFAAIEFRNGQLGNLKFQAMMCIYELICSNGATINKGNFNLINAVHLGKNFYWNAGLVVSRYNDMIPKLRERFDSMTAITVKRVKEIVVDRTPVKFRSITKELALEMYNYIIDKDRLIAKNDSSSLWNLVRGITEFSQTKKEYQRFELDEFSNEFADAIIRSYNG